MQPTCLVWSSRLGFPTEWVTTRVNSAFGLWPIQYLWTRPSICSSPHSIWRLMANACTILSRYEKVEKYFHFFQCCLDLTNPPFFLWINKFFYGLRGWRKRAIGRSFLPNGPAFHVCNLVTVASTLDTFCFWFVQEWPRISTDIYLHRFL